MEEIGIVDRRGGCRVSWRSLWAGLFMVAGVEIVMQLFGIAIGVSALGNRGAVEGVTIWQGIWTIVSTLSAFFFGGWLAASVEAPARRSDGVITGAAVWGFATTIGVFLLAAGLFGALGIGQAMAPAGSAAVRQGGAVSALHNGITIGAAWATFGTVLVSLACAIGGALIGIAGEKPRVPRERVLRERVVEERRVPTAPLTPGETY